FRTPRQTTASFRRRARPGARRRSGDSGPGPDAGARSGGRDAAAGRRAMRQSPRQPADRSGAPWESPWLAGAPHPDARTHEPAAHHDSSGRLVWFKSIHEPMAWHARCQEVISAKSWPPTARRPRCPATGAVMTTFGFRFNHRKRAFALAEQLHRVDQGLQHSQHQRDADETPGEHELQGGRGALLIGVVHVGFPPQARAPARMPIGSTPRSSFSLMWNFLSTGLTKKLQMKPITSNPAMMYMVVL